MSCSLSTLVVDGNNQSVDSFELIKIAGLAASNGRKWSCL